MAYIGKGFKDIATANIAVNTMVGDGSDTTLGLSMGSKGVGSVNDVSIFADGIQQRPGTDFTLSGSTITFTTAPANGVKVVAMSHGDSWNNAPADGTVTISKLKDTSVTSNKIIGLDAGKLSGSLSGSGVNLTNLNAASITGTLPAIDGSALTGVSAYENETSDPTATENKTLGTMWVNKTSGEMYILTDDTTNANVWTNVGDGTGTQPFTGMVATGGTITTNGDYKVHTFNNSGTFTVTASGTDAEVEYLVIAGGGGGSRRSSAGGDGGGGAGGYRTATAYSISAQAYTVTVGAGGAGQTSANGSAGSNSVFSAIQTTGGGGGAWNHEQANQAATGGGSAGGGGWGSDYHSHPMGSGNAGGYDPVEGYDGGLGGYWDGPHGIAGGGGGGAGGVGADAHRTSNIITGGDGGVGRSSSITGTAVMRAGGGGGGGDSRTSGPGGAGGAGGGGVGGGTGTTPTSGTVNTGGGGGGVGSGSSGSVMNGGSGTVIIRYKFQ